jgi:acetyl-CoA acetyltransferase
VETLAAMAAVAALSAVGGSAEVRGRIDAVWFGAMGVTQRDMTGRLHPRHIPNHIAESADLGRVLAGGGATRCHAVLGTSDAGAVVLHEAVRALRDGRCTAALVVAGEQMQTAGGPLPKPTDAEDYGQAIRSVVDPVESGPYGLTMLSVGDWVMDHIAWLSGVQPEAWAGFLERVALAKHQASLAWPWGMYAGKYAESPDKYALDAERYRKGRKVTRWFRAYDVGGPASGASALVLTTDPALVRALRDPKDRSPWLRVAGIGGGQDRVPLRERGGAVVRSNAVRRALVALCHDARVPPSALGDAKLASAVLHDAFPSVELATLFELARLRGDADGDALAWATRWMLSGDTNPLGGLTANGHALGNTGVFQIAALHRAKRGPGTPMPLRRPLCLVTSVGSALTNIEATLLLHDRDPLQPEPPIGQPEPPIGHALLERLDPAYVASVPALERADADALQAPPSPAPIPDGADGVIVAQTPFAPFADPPHGVALVATAAGRTVAALRCPAETGAAVLVDSSAHPYRAEPMEHPPHRPEAPAALARFLERLRHEE